MLTLFAKPHVCRYGKNNITPYLHILVAHVPTFMMSLGSLRVFSGSATELGKSIFFLFLAC